MEMTLTRALTGFVLGSTVLMLFMAVANEHAPPNGGERTFYNLQVMKLGVDGYHYQFRDMEGTVFWGKFCSDLEPMFDAGMTLTIMKIQDFGSCWSIHDTHPAYLIKRDDKGNIIREEFHVN